MKQNIPIYTVYIGFGWQL